MPTVAPSPPLTVDPLAAPTADPLPAPTGPRTALRRPDHSPK
jgi:hypothetical protein